MSNYRSMIDQAMNAARARAHTPVETAKVASSDSWIKEANDLAGALEFLSLSASGGDNVAAFRQEMIREFYKSASSGDPVTGPTMSSGTQGIAPTEGKTKIAPKGLVGGNAPTQTTVSATTKDGDKAMLESFKQAGGQSLYDVLMGNKTAAAGGPAEHDAETMAGVGTGNENSTYRKTLHTNEGPVNANRRELKKSTRARLAEAFAHTNDTLGDATAAQIFPQAASRGNLKIANQEVAGLGGAALGPLGAALGADDGQRMRSGLGSAVGLLGGAGLGAVPGLVMNDPALYRVGKAVGAMTGSGAGAYLAHKSPRELEKEKKLNLIRERLAAEADTKTAGARTARYLHGKES